MIMKKYLIALICMTATFAVAELRVLTVNNGVISATNIAGNAYRLDYGGGCVEDWTALGGGDHCGNNWTIDGDDLLEVYGGIHTNIGTLTITDTYVLVENSVKFYANTISITETATVKAYGHSGGGGGGGGGSNWSSEESGSPGSGGSGGDVNGSNGQQGGEDDRYVDVRYGGNGGDGGNGQGAYGGNKGSGGDGGTEPLSASLKHGDGGSRGDGGGYNNDASDQIGTGGNVSESKSQTLYVGSGGGGGGGGGGGAGITGGGGGGGAAGGTGGGAVYLYATSSATVNGEINCEAQGPPNGGPGTDGQNNPPGSIAGDGGNGSDRRREEAGFRYPQGGTGGAGDSGPGYTAGNGGNGNVGGAGAGGGILIYSPSITISSTAVLNCRNSYGQSINNAGSVKIFYGSTYINNGTRYSARLYEYNDL